MRWRGDKNKQQHLFSDSDGKQHKMGKYCGKKVGADYYILMLNGDNEESE